MAMAVLVALSLFVNLRCLMMVAALAAIAVFVVLLPAEGYGHFAPFFACGVALYLATTGYRPAAVLAIVAGVLSVVAADELRGLFLVLLPTAAGLCVLVIKAQALDRTLGELSYPVYLGHWIPLVPFDHAAPPSHPIMVLGLGLIVPVLLWLLIEPTIRRLRDFVRGVSIGGHSETALGPSTVP
jgi:peptidoglycan/LPS O-acetylase OafA/YrhL